jgi:protein involved in plasmid replication-relaxation
MGATARRRPAPSRAKTPALSDLDLRILSLLSRHRVMTQTRLAAVSPGVPIRTLRYRCSGLARQGLLGRTRPYRERGSAPNHLWPTRKGEATVSGGPPPLGGERREPNPLFLAHAAGLTEVWVALETSLPEGARLAEFRREAEAREPFTVPATRRERAIAPDALVEITDADSQPLLAFLELDMGTMSHRRLRQKASGYGDYVEAEAWRERHHFCPALLFVTTTEKRARSFLTAMHKEAGKDSLLLTCACDLARHLDRIADAPCWLRSARRPARGARGGRAPGGREGPRAVDLGPRGPPRPPTPLVGERTALRRTGSGGRRRARDHPRAHRPSGGGRAPGAARPRHDARGPATAASAGREPTARQRRAFADLVDHHKDEQLGRITDLALHHGEGPALRGSRRQVSGGGLLSSSEVSWLDAKAEDDERSREEQERLATSYLAWRETEAKRLVKAQGIVARIGTQPEDFFGEVDRRSLRFCRACGEIAYPDPERARGERRRPHFAFRRGERPRPGRRVLGLPLGLEEGRRPAPTSSG